MRQRLDRGSLAALIHFDHPVIAMRTLNAAWPDSQVDPVQSLLGLLMRSLVPSYLRFEQDRGGGPVDCPCADLCACANVKKRVTNGPHILISQWLCRLPRDAASRSYLQPFPSLSRALRLVGWRRLGGLASFCTKRSRTTKIPFLGVAHTNFSQRSSQSTEYRGARWPWRGGVKTIPEIQRHLRGWPTPKFNTARTSDLVKKLEAWPDGV